jgi:hypothetical protein
VPMNFFQPRPGRFGVAPVYLKTAQIGGTNFEGGATPVTASGTTIFRLGGFAGRRVELSRIGATTVTVPVSASGTILATLRKYRAADDTVVTLTGTLDLEALVTREEGFTNVLATLSDADRTLAAGDALEVHVVSTAAIGTQPAGLVFTVEGLVQM